MGKLKEKLLKAELIVIYGAGHIANITYYYLKEIGCIDKLCYFVVSRKENNPSKLHGLKVVEFTEVADNLLDKYVLIATVESTQIKISNILKEKGIWEFERIKEDELWDEYYSCLYSLPIANNKLLFSNMLQNGYGGNPKYIADKLLEIDKLHELDIVWVVADEKYEMPARVRKVIRDSEEYYHELVTSHIWIDNARKNSWIRKRNGQYYIQTWHGAAPIKKVEKDAIQALSPKYIDAAKNDSKMADMFLSGSKFYSELYKHFNKIDLLFSLLSIVLMLFK